MGKTSEFASVLGALRRRQGFASPYAFFKGRGSRKGLGLSFANYLRLERGKGLPKGWRLERILSALGFEPSSQEAGALVRAYVRDLLGSDLLSAALAAAPDPAPTSWILSENAARQAISQRAVQLTMTQYKLIARDAAVYRCHVVLANTLGGMDRDGLAAAAGLPKPAAAKAVKALAAGGMAKLSGGRIHSPLAGKYVTPPAPTAAFMDVYGRLRRHRAAWVGQRGRLIHSPYLLLRARRGDFTRFLGHLSDVVGLSAIYGDVRPAGDSELYLVEGAVHRLSGPTP